MRALSFKFRKQELRKTSLSFFVLYCASRIKFCVWRGCYVSVHGPELFVKVCPPVASCALSWLKLLARRCILSSYRSSESFVHMRPGQGTLVKAFGSKKQLLCTPVAITSYAFQSSTFYCTTGIVCPRHVRWLQACFCDTLEVCQCDMNSSAAAKVNIFIVSVQIPHG